MCFSNKLFSLYLVFQIVLATIRCDSNMSTNPLTGDDFEKRRSVKEFFDTLVAGSNQNTKTSSQMSMPSTPRPDMPIYMPFAVPVHQPPPAPLSPHVHIAPPSSYGYSPNLNHLYRSQHSAHPHAHHMPTRHHLQMAHMGHGFGQPHHHHNYNHEHNHNNYGHMISPMNQNFGTQSHHYSVPHSPIHSSIHSPMHSPMHSPYNHDYGQHSRPIAIAIPLPLHAIPLHLFANNGNNGNNGNNEDNLKSNNFLPQADFNDGESPSTKFALFADPFEEVGDEDLYDNTNNLSQHQQFKFVPKN